MGETGTETVILDAEEYRRFRWELRAAVGLGQTRLGRLWVTLWEALQAIARCAPTPQGTYEVDLFVLHDIRNAVAILQMSVRKDGLWKLVEEIVRQREIDHGREHA